jgi:hypothetical protein
VLASRVSTVKAPVAFLAGPMTLGSLLGRLPGLSMLTIEQSRQLLSNPQLTDEEVEEIRDGFKRFAEVIFEKWQEDNIKKYE